MPIRARLARAVSGNGGIRTLDALRNALLPRRILLCEIEPPRARVRLTPRGARLRIRRGRWGGLYHVIHEAAGRSDRACARCGRRYGTRGRRSRRKVGRQPGRRQTRPDRARKHPGMPARALAVWMPMASSCSPHDSHHAIVLGQLPPSLETPSAGNAKAARPPPDENPLIRARQLISPKLISPSGGLPPSRDRVQVILIGIAPRKSCLPMLTPQCRRIE
jgi:hypothetical protein